MVELTYLGTATLALTIGGTRILTDPAFDQAGATYDFGPWYTPRSWFASEKRYDTPVGPASSGTFDAVLVSHDQHADNLDHAGRALVADPERAARVVTTVAGARRLARPVSGKDGPGRGLGLGERVIGLAPGAGTRVGAVTITATLARHGPFYAPQVHEVVGFLLDVESGPRIWISGDTVLYPALAAELAELGLRRPVDVAVVHCGAVRFPRVPVLGKERFTFDAREAIEACRLVQARKIVPVHRSGWSHFLQPEAELEAAFASSELAERTTVLDLGATLRLT